MKKCISIGYLLLHSIAVFAAPATISQDHALIENVALAFVQQHSAALPGKVTYKIDKIDQRLALPACKNLEAFLPAGSQFIGNTAIGVRCMEKYGWSIFVPVRIKVGLDLLVTTRQLPLGHTLQQQDLSIQTMEISQNVGFTELTQVVGKVLRYSIAAGQVLREDMLRLPFSVAQGRTVQLVTQGDGFDISNEAVALNNASEGQGVQIRTGSGRVISGIARTNGVVEVSP